MLDLDDPIGRQPDQLLDDVEQFAHVARPPVALERPKRLVRERHLAPGTGEKMPRERMNVFGPFTQGGHMKMDDPQAIEEILAEVSRRHVFGEIAVGRCHDANVDARLRLIRPDRLNLTVLQEPQQQGLHAQAHLTDFVEEQRAVVRELDLPLLVAVGAGEAALHVSEQFGLEEGFGQPGAVHRHERGRLAGRLVVNESRNHVLAHAALAGNEYLRGALCGPLGNREQFGHGTAGDDGRRYLSAYRLKLQGDDRRAPLSNILNSKDLVKSTAPGGDVRPSADDVR